jgi:nucleoporin POM152
MAFHSSGDTGVSASLVLHGTPPFQVYYRTQRDKEQPRDLVKTFPNARGELTLQPERSGHYVYTFVQMSDANYKKVELDGPSIDQVVHPLAAAEFVAVGGGGARSKRMVNSCSGNIVDAEVDLRVCCFGSGMCEVHLS